VHRLEENLGALTVELTESDLQIIENSTPKNTVGARY
jgi:aryl-alcohol dehydrogenase-like predicted oxidoreductase